MYLESFKCPKKPFPKDSWNLNLSFLNAVITQIWFEASSRFSGHFIFLLRTRIHFGEAGLKIHIFHTKLALQASQIAHS